MVAPYASSSFRINNTQPFKEPQGYCRTKSVMYERSICPQKGAEVVRLYHTLFADAGNVTLELRSMNSVKVQETEEKPGGFEGQVCPVPNGRDRAPISATGSWLRTVSGRRGGPV